MGAPRMDEGPRMTASPIAVGDRVEFPPAFAPLNPWIREGEVTRLQQWSDTLFIATVTVKGAGPIRMFRCNANKLTKVQP